MSHPAEVRSSTRKCVSWPFGTISWASQDPQPLTNKNKNVIGSAWGIQYAYPAFTSFKWFFANNLQKNNAANGGILVVGRPTFFGKVRRSS